MAEEKKTTRGRKPKTETVELKEEVLDSKDLTIKQLQEQVAQLMAMMGNNSQNNQTVVVQQNNDMSRTVRAISTLPYTLVIPVNGDGGKTGTVYRFNKFGEVQNIRFTDMPTILSKMARRFENGDIILQSEKDYKDLGLEYIMNTVFTLENLKNLTSLEDDNSIETILSLDESVRDKVISIIAQRIADGENFDYNKIRALEDEGFEVTEMADLIATKIK